MKNNSTTFIEKDKYFIIKACTKNLKKQIEAHHFYLLKNIFFLRR